MAQPLHTSGDIPSFDTYPSTAPVQRTPAQPMADIGTPGGAIRGRSRWADRIPRPRMDDLKNRFQVIRSRTAGGASNARHVAQHNLQLVQQRARSGYRSARVQGERYAREYPVQSILAIGAAAFVVGAIIRWGRSNDDIRQWE